MLPAEPGGRGRAAGQQRPQAHIDAHHVIGPERVGEDPVHVLQQVVDVGLGGGRLGPVEVPVGVGRADDPEAAPADHEQHALLGPEDEPRLRADPVGRHGEVDPLGHADPVLAAADLGGELLGPDPGREHHLAPADLEVAAGLQVADTDAGHPLAVAQEPGRAGAGGQQGPVAGGGAGRDQGVRASSTWAS
jgi:hypothetical protein